MTRCSSISAMSSRRLPHREHSRTSNPKLRCMSSAHSQFVRGRSVAAPGAPRRRRRRLRRTPGIGRGQPCAPRRPCPQHPVVQQQIDPRPRSQRSQPLQQFQRIEDQVRRAIRPSMPKLQDHLALPRQVQTVLRDRRAQLVPAQAFELSPIASRHAHIRVEVVTPRARVTQPEPRRRERKEFVRAAMANRPGPARSPSARRPCTEAAATAASTGASSCQRSRPASPTSCATPRRVNRRWTRRSIVAMQSVNLLIGGGAAA